MHILLFIYTALGVIVVLTIYSNCNNSLNVIVILNNDVIVQLNNYAQEWANTLKGQGIQHRTDNLYGENIYKSSDGDNIGQQAVNAWYNELALYNLNDGEEELYGHDAIRK